MTTINDWDNLGCQELVDTSLVKTNSDSVIVHFTSSLNLNSTPPCHYSQHSSTFPHLTAFLSCTPPQCACVQAPSYGGQVFLVVVAPPHAWRPFLHRVLPCFASVFSSKSLKLGSLHYRRRTGKKPFFEFLLKFLKRISLVVGLEIAHEHSRLRPLLFTGMKPSSSVEPSPSVSKVIPKLRLLELVTGSSSVSILNA
jgi:hypothetical protein